MKSDDKQIRVLGEALMPSEPTEPSYVVFLSSLNNWEIPPDVALTEADKKDVINAIIKHFLDQGSVIEFE